MSLDHHRIEVRVLFIICQDIEKSNIGTNNIKNYPQWFFDIFDVFHFAWMFY